MNSWITRLTFVLAQRQEHRLCYCIMTIILIIPPSAQRGSRTQQKIQAATYVLKVCRCHSAQRFALKVPAAKHRVSVTQNATALNLFCSALHCSCMDWSHESWKITHIVIWRPGCLIWQNGSRNRYATGCIDPIITAAGNHNECALIDLAQRYWSYLTVW